MVLPHSKHIIDHLRTRGNATAFRDHEQSLTFQRLAGRALAIADSLILSGLPLSSPVAIALSPGSLAEFVAVTAVLASGNVVVPLFGQAEHQGKRNVLRKPSRCGAVIYTATDRGLGQTFDALVARIEVDDDAFVVASFDGANNCQPEPSGTLCRSENHNQKIQIDTEAVNQLGSWLGERLQLQSTSSLFVPLPLSAELRWFAIYASLAVGCCLVGGDPWLKTGSTATGSNTSPNPDIVCTTREAALAAQTNCATADTPLPTTGCLIQQANDDLEGWFEAPCQAAEKQILLRATANHGLCFFVADDAQPSFSKRRYLGQIFPFVEHRFEQQDQDAATAAKPEQGILYLRSSDNGEWLPLLNQPLLRHNGHFFW